MDKEFIENYYVYKKFIAKKKRKNIWLILFSAIFLVLLMYNSSRPVIILTLILCMSMIAMAVLEYKQLKKGCTNAIHGYVKQVSKVSRQTGQEAVSGTTGFDDIKFRPIWMFTVESDDGNTSVKAERVETLLSDTHDIRNEDVKEGMPAVAFRLGKKDYMILDPPNDGMDLSNDDNDDDEYEEYEEELEDEECDENEALK